jgi:hypothetical protein
VDHTSSSALLNPSRRSHEDVPLVDGLGPKSDAQQLVWVMRHGHRQDEEDDRWRETAYRAWDPPLSVKGRQQVGMAAV